MAGDAKSELRRVLLQTIEGYIGAVERSGGAGSKELRSGLAAFQISPQFKFLLDDAFDHLARTIQKESLKGQRSDAFQRLLAHPLSDAFASGRLSRDYLGNYFSFIHLVLGDQMTALSARSEAIANEIRKEEPHAFDWDMFYEDERSIEVLWVVLTRIAETFRRFDARKEWFFGLMEYKPQTISVSSHAFIPRPANESGEPPPLFGNEEFNVMFACLFGPMRHLDATQRRRFEKDFGRPVEKVFGPLWENLEASGAVL